MKVALAQIAPVLLDRDATLARVVDRVVEAGAAGCALVGFGEALVPGYPVWLGATGGARFDDDYQKRIHALYLDQSVTIERGHLAPVCAAARDHGVAVVLGVVERPADRGGHTAYCSRVFIAADGTVASVHRKLMPTYEERLVWGVGDGAGLVVHPVGDFTVGALNCWENWMPMARAALYAQGEDLHVMIWPGSEHNTAALTPVVARESRSYVLSVSALLRPGDIPASIPEGERWFDGDGWLMNGGSCIAAPDGSWVIAPTTEREGLLVADLDPELVRRERHNFDPSGHYSRPDVLNLTVDRRRQGVIRTIDE